MNTNRRQFIGGALSATALSGLCMPAIAQNAPIRIGCITSLVGGYSLFGEAQARGMEIAAEMVNSQGGINGRQIEIIVRDDGLKPEIGVATARELAAQGVHIFAGVVATGVALAMSGIMEELNSVFINSASHGNSLTHQDFRPNYFRVSDYSAMRIGAGSQLMAERYPDVRRWGFISPDNEVGRSVVETANFWLPETYRRRNNAEIELLETSWVKFGASNFRNEIARLMSQEVEGLLVGLTGADEVTFLQQAGQFGLTERLKATYTSGNEFHTAMALRNRTPPSNYWSGFHWYYGAYPDNALAQQLVKSYRDKGYGQHPDGLTGIAHTAVLAAVEALKTGAGETADELVPVLEGLTFDTVKGRITLRKEDHQAISEINYAQLGPAENEDGWEVIDYARVDGTEFAGKPTPGVALKFE